MKAQVSVLFLSLSLLASLFSRSQSAKSDSLQLFETQMAISEDSLIRQLAVLKDEDRVDLLGYMTFYYAFIDPQKGFALGSEGIKLSERLNYKRGIAYCNQSISFCLMVTGNYNEGLRFALTSLQLYEDLGDFRRIAYNYLTTANIYREIGDYKRGLAEASRAIRINDSIGFNQKVAYAVIGSIYEKADQLDSALKYIQLAYQLDVVNNEGQWGWLVYLLGNIHAKMNHDEVALSYYRMALPLVVKENVPKDIVDVYNGFSRTYKRNGRLDSCVFYANKVINSLKHTEYTQGILEAANTLVQVYKTTNRKDSLVKYLEMSVALSQELYTSEKEREVQNLSFKESIRIQENENAKVKAAQERRRNLQLLLIAAFIITFGIAVIIISRNRSMLKSARFLALLALLLVFEFISLLLHPLIEKTTNHNPILTLLILVILASALVPAHHKLESFIRSKLTLRRRRKPKQVV